MEEELKPQSDAISSLESEVVLRYSTAETDKNGNAKIKGFYGDYDILIDGKTHKATVTKGGVNEINIVL